MIGYDDLLPGYVGLPVVKSQFAQDKIVLDLPHDRRIVLEAEGDCCSRSWFEEALETSAFRDNAAITGIQRIEMPAHLNPTNEENGGYDNVYGVAIYTTLGICTIEMRNNGGNGGYYGGYIRIFYYDGTSNGAEEL